MENYGMIRENLKDLVYRELNTIGNEGELSPDCIHVLFQLMDIDKDIEETNEKERINMESYYGDEGYSSRGRMMPRYYDGNSYGNGNYNISGTYNNDGSYRGGMGMGRSRSGGYSRDDGRSDMILQLEKLWNEARDDYDKEAIKRVMREISQKQNF